MKQSCFMCHLRLIVTIAAILAFFAPSTLRAQQTPAAKAAQSNPLSIDQVRLGYSGRFRPGRLTPVFVQISNDSASVAATQIRIIHKDSDGDDVEWIADAPLGPKQSRWVNMIIRPQPSMLWARDAKISLGVADGDDFEPVEAFQLNDPSHGAIGRKTLTPIEASEVAVGIIGNSTGPFSGLEIEEQGQQDFSVFAISPESLVSDWRALDMVDVLLWQDPDMASISGDVQEALSQWIIRGGKMVFMLGPHAMSLNSTRDNLRRLLPSRVKSAQISVKDARELSYFLTGISRSTGAVSIADLQPIGSGEVVRSADGLALLCSKSCYGGQVIVIAGTLKDFGYDKFIKLPIGKQLMRSLLGFSTYNSLVETTEITLDINSMLSPPSVGGLLIVLALFLTVIYILLAGPVSWVVLKRRKKERLAWWTFGAVAIIASVAFAFLTRFGLSDASASYAGIMDMENKSSFVNMRGFCGVYLPEHGLAEVSTSDDYSSSLSPLILDSVSATGGFADSRKYSIYENTPHTMSPFFRRTVKRMAFNYSGGIEGDISASLRLSKYEKPLSVLDIAGTASSREYAWQLQGTIENKLKYDLVNPVLIFMNPDDKLVITRLEKIPAGKTVEIDTHKNTDFNSRMYSPKDHFKLESFGFGPVGYHGPSMSLSQFQLAQLGSCASLVAVGHGRYFTLEAMDLGQIDKSSSLRLGKALLMAEIQRADDLLAISVDSDQVDTDGYVIMRMPFDLAAEK